MGFIILFPAFYFVWQDAPQTIEELTVQLPFIQSFASGEYLNIYSPHTHFALGVLTYPLSFIFENIESAFAILNPFEYNLEAIANSSLSNIGISILHLQQYLISILFDCLIF